MLERHGEASSGVDSQNDDRGPGILVDDNVPLRIVAGSSRKDEERKSEGPEVLTIAGIDRLVGTYACDSVRLNRRILIGETISKRQLAEANLVIVGGPRSNGEMEEYLEKLDLPVKYIKRVPGKSRHCYQAEGVTYQNSGSDQFHHDFTDYGILVFSKNPWNPNNKAVGIAGLSSRASFGIIEMIEKNSDMLFKFRNKESFVALVETKHINDQLVSKQIVWSNVPK